MAIWLFDNCYFACFLQLDTGGIDRKQRKRAEKNVMLTRNADIHVRTQSKHKRSRHVCEVIAK